VLNHYALDHYALNPYDSIANNPPTEINQAMHENQHSTEFFATLTHKIKNWGLSLGFQGVGISDIDLQEAEGYLNTWLKENNHGSMSYMAKHGLKRTRPDLLEPGTLRIISVRFDYFPENTTDPWKILHNHNNAYISRYSLGRDYHKVLRKRLKKLADKIHEEMGEFGYRVFVDSAPVMEKAIAEKSGLGWIGKHSNLLSRDAGSWFFLGEIYVDIPLKVDEALESHCGSCTACIDDCPTKAIVAPYRVDARRCISYLTIENKNEIPIEFRKAMGNRIYGCDDCQLVCPWNKFSQNTTETDFTARHSLDNISLLELFNWNEEIFLKNTEGSAIRRIGYQSWLRNIAVALGNAEKSEKITEALEQKRKEANDMVKEHIDWALNELNPPLE